MTPERWRRVREIFERALDLDAAERDRFVAEACAGDDDLDRRVRRLLESDASATDALEPPSIPEVNVAEGARLGGFRIRRVLGSGGMGTVYEAEQDHPHRAVALKVLRLGLRSDSALRRFRFESEVLARLVHPGIAHVYGAGTERDPGGLDVPWIAMEVVKGARDLIAFANEGHLDRRARLELFLQVCDAVQHGHRHGVIHRDLKPSNLLVDESGRVKVIDFGVARSSEPGAAPTLATEPGQIIGTLAYMSPEALDASPRGVDVRSDVYSLGVVLYELLTGALPHDLAGKSLTESARIVRDARPRRATDVSPSLPREIDWILGRALEKDPDARYASVADFAADVQRHLAGEPVVAVPPSALYRARKFAARHRVGVAVTIAIATLLVAGLIGTSLGWRRALEQERAARDQSRRSDAIRQVLHTMLILASPQLSGPDVKLLDGLDAIVPDVRAYFREQPDLQVVVLTDIGHVYLDIGQWEKARITLEQTIAIASEKLDPWSLDRGTAENVLGLALLTLRRGAEAEPHFRLADDILGRHGLHSTADGLAVRQNLVSSLGMQGRPEEVLALLEPLAAENTRLLGPDHPDTLTTRNNIAQVERGMGRLNEAYRDAAAVLEASRRTQGRDSLAAASGAHNLAAILADLGHFAEAYALEREAVDGWKRILGARHPNVLGGLFTAAACALALDRAGDAVDLFGEIDRGSDATQVDGETECVRLLIAVASADAKTAGSSASLRDAVARASETLTPGDPDLEIARAAVVRFEHLRHAPADAVTHLRSIVDRWESPNGVHVWQLRVARRWLAEALDSQGLVAEAQVVRASLDK